MDAKRPAMSLEGSGITNLINKIDPEFTHRESNWEIGLNIGLNSQRTISFISLLNSDSNMVAPNNRFAPLFTANSTNVMEDLYLDSSVGADFETRFQPIFRLSVDRKISRSLLL